VLRTISAKTSLNVLCIARPSTIASAPEVAASPRTEMSSAKASEATGAARKSYDAENVLKQSVSVPDSRSKNGVE
jgi:hypothetical protein